MSIEACGILAGKRRNVNGLPIKEVLRVYRCANELKSSTEYQISAEEQFSIFRKIDDVGLDLLGFYHSHPSTSSRPSLIDEKRANYEGYSYLIISLHPLKVSSWVLERRETFEREEIDIQQWQRILFDEKDYKQCSSMVERHEENFRLSFRNHRKHSPHLFQSDNS